MAAGEGGEEGEEEEELPEGVLAGALGEVMEEVMEGPDAEVYRKEKEEQAKATLFKGEESFCFFFHFRRGRE